MAFFHRLDHSVLALPYPGTPGIDHSDHVLIDPLSRLEILVNDYYAIKTKIIAFIIVTSTTYWLYTSFFLTSILLQTVDSATVPKLSETMSQINPGNEFIFLENNITTAIIIFFVIIRYRVSLLGL